LPVRLNDFFNHSLLVEPKLIALPLRSKNSAKFINE